ncbi:hypothetical protein QJS10_CPA07g00748 [Acorus calamus]|uniref:Uncharacterized protein n=1 Tax=Acorus calamus TaxID=4465 RepID=A0AAV9EF37_ACOCL|nr:hypothetical protein QJS10_CPA07g00748 [Acorus calamus]
MEKEQQTVSSSARVLNKDSHDISKKSEQAEDGPWQCRSEHWDSKQNINMVEQAIVRASKKRGLEMQAESSQRDAERASSNIANNQDLAMELFRKSWADADPEDPILKSNASLNNVGMEIEESNT